MSCGNSLCLKVVGKDQSSSPFTQYVLDITKVISMKYKAVIMWFQVVDVSSISTSKKNPSKFWSAVVHKTGSPPDKKHFRLFRNETSRNFSLVADLGNGNSVENTITIQIQTWYHVALTVNPSFGLSLFLDGKEIGRNAQINDMNTDSFGLITE